MFKPRQLALLTLSTLLASTAHAEPIATPLFLSINNQAPSDQLELKAQACAGHDAGGGKQAAQRRMVHQRLQQLAGRTAASILLNGQRQACRGYMEVADELLPAHLQRMRELSVSTPLMRVWAENGMKLIDKGLT